MELFCFREYIRILSLKNLAPRSVPIYIKKNFSIKARRDLQRQIDAGKTQRSVCQLGISANFRKINMCPTCWFFLEILIFKVWLCAESHFSQISPRKQIFQQKNLSLLIGAQVGYSFIEKIPKISWHCHFNIPLTLRNAIIAFLFNHVPSSSVSFKHLCSGV